VEMRVKSVPLDEWNSELESIRSNLRNVVVGKEEVVRLVLTALLANGHCLIEDVPGVGKTLLVKAIAKSLGCEFKRIQFTPDLLPSDVTGLSIYNQKSQEFEFRPGPIFGQIVLADEINRTSPKTQAALLEALEEQSVTADGHTYLLPSPFFVLATENPIEFEGTFPLPEAQLDRFLLKFGMGYPSVDDELEILRHHGTKTPLESMTAVASPADVVRWRKVTREVHVEDEIARYIVHIVQATRKHANLVLGASPRASLALYRSAQAFAFTAGRNYVVPDDVRHLTPYVLVHRMMLSAEARLSGHSMEGTIGDILSKTRIPSLHGVSY
jgi:MoxR-like ATPase